jgi:peptide-methionine (R)-S-oxide reductase
MKRPYATRPIRWAEKITKTEAQWKAQLSSKAYYVLREKGTEWPYTSKWLKNKTKGTYVCAGCGNPVFASETKFESGTGWPSFFAPLRKTAWRRTKTAASP